jgi:hypothetical protein
MRLPFLLLFLTSISTAAFSNFKLLPGYYIEKNGDSVRCTIDYKDWNNNPEIIQVEVNNEKRTLGVSDIIGFGIVGFGDYKAATISYHTNPISGLRIPENFSDSVETRRVFLRMLVKGPYTLYELVTSERFYFFLGERDSTIYELVYRVKQKNMVFNEDQQYKNVLSDIFINEGILDRHQNRINLSTYNSSDIRSLVEILNESRTGVKTKKIGTKLFQVDLFAGAIINSFPSILGGRYATASFNSSTSFSGGINFMYSIPNNFKALKFGFSVGYDSYSASTSRSGTLIDSSSPNNIHSFNFTETYAVSNKYMMLPNIYVLYLLNPTNKINFYLRAGFCLSIAFGRGIDVQSNFGQYNISISEKVPYFNAGFGVLAGRNKLDILYYPASQASTTTGAPFKVGMIGAYYYFTVL